MSFYSEYDEKGRDLDDLGHLGRSWYYIRTKQAHKALPYLGYLGFIFGLAAYWFREGKVDAALAWVFFGVLLSSPELIFRWLVGLCAVGVIVVTPVVLLWLGVRDGKLWCFVMGSVWILWLAAELAPGIYEYFKKDNQNDV